MKINTFFTLILIISLSLFVNSCKVIYPNERKIIGKWTPVKVEKISLQEPSAVASTPRPKPKTPADSTTLKSDQNSLGMDQNSKTDIQLNRFAAAEERTPLEVYQEKHILVKNYPQTSYKGTWKMKKKGMQVQVKNIQTGEKRTVDIVHLNDTSAVLLERFPFGDIKITYHKER